MKRSLEVAELVTTEGKHAGSLLFKYSSNAISRSVAPVTQRHLKTDNKSADKNTHTLNPQPRHGDSKSPYLCLTQHRPLNTSIQFNIKNEITLMLISFHRLEDGS
ncbi:hypothetical protein CHARACLAT_032265 [Characodon lateralis]|uniref:Uncharacterized protein n=1 Tax=Characodon lateralis TaxID=208331 RepID=A0ABU7EG22_9TELE|nr:hypothetical protein [Characodon lateralis]